ncbi:MAG: TetR/AcrR family transcriptional regulator [Lachnospiraceae bacterium]
MYRGCNKTALTSQEQIADAFISLLRENPYDSISVCAICREAGVSRQTFYSLFESKENIILYEVGQKHRFTPGENCCCAEQPLTLRGLCREFSGYITEKREFLSLLARNNIFYYVNEGLSASFMDCPQFLPDLSPDRRAFAAGFAAGGLSGAAQVYVSEGENMGPDELEDIFYTLLSGEFAAECRQRAEQPDEAAGGSDKTAE